MKILTTWCEDDHRHRIGLTDKGQLVALDHSPKFRREKAFAELGGRMPYCYRTVKDLLRGDHSLAAMPEAVKAEAAEANRKRHERRRRKSLCRDMTTPEKYTALTRLAVSSALSGCYQSASRPTYDLPRDGTYTLQLRLVRFAEWDRLVPAEFTYFSGGRVDEWRLRMPTRWWMRVHLRGLDVVRGYLVLDAFSEIGPGGWPHLYLTVLTQASGDRERFGTATAGPFPLEAPFAFRGWTPRRGDPGRRG